MNLTIDEISVITDALARHAVAIDLGDDPTNIYDGSRPDGHPLTVLAKYRELTANASHAVNKAYYAARNGDTVTITVSN